MLSSATTVCRASRESRAGMLTRFRRTLAEVSVAALFAASVACSTDSGSSSGTGGYVGATGGSTGSGASPGTGGGSTATGGAAMTTGGASATGGALGSGGTATGGSTATGGTTATGGRTAVGGMTGTGGASATGGATSSGTGGAAAGGTAGSVGTGGSEGGQGGVGSGTAGASAGGGSESTGGSTGFMPCPTDGTACAIMPVGDSITEGCCSNTWGGYRIELFRQSLTDQKNITFVGTLTNGPTMVDNQPFPQKHEGHGGWKISQIAGVIDNAIRQDEPHIVLLKIGTNDINGNDDIANAPNRLASLIDQITNDVPSALLVVSAIIPTTNDGTNQRVRDYNAAIQVKAEEAAAAGKHVVFIDNYAVFEEDPNYKSSLMADGLHPNQTGYEVLGQSFYDLISELLPAR